MTKVTDTYFQMAVLTFTRIEWRWVQSVCVFWPAVVLCVHKKMPGFNSENDVLKTRKCISVGKNKRMYNVVLVSK